jgi:ankyrin repeat protein/nucleoside-triphosphatase THEP1
MDFFVVVEVDSQFFLWPMEFRDTKYGTGGWTVLTSGTCEIILDDYFANKIAELHRDYFKRRNGKELPGVFEIANDVTEITLNSAAGSVFLGLFLAAAKKCQNRSFKNNWASITVTGDLTYSEKDGWELKAVGSIVEKYKAVREFARQHRSDTDNRKHLFLYISEKEEKKIPPDDGKMHGTHGNITVKHFPPDKTIKDIINYLFDYEPRQQELLRKMENYGNYRFAYIQGEGFQELVQGILDNSELRGYFITGEGGSGKSAFAMEIIRRLYEKRIIYAPIYVRVGDDKFLSIIKETISNLPDIESKSRNKLEEYFVLNIAKYLWKEYAGMEYNMLLQKMQELNPRVINELSKEDYLVLIDNLELPESGVEQILTAINKIFRNLETLPYLIITSQNKCSNLKYSKDLRLKPIEPISLEKSKIEKLIMNMIEVMAKYNDLYKEKITRAKNNGNLTDLVEIIVEKLSHNPRRISDTLSSLMTNMEVDELIEIIKKEHYRYTTDLNNYDVKICENKFSFLDETQKKILYLFLKIGNDTPVSQDEILERIKESKQWGKQPLKHELKIALNTLLDLYLIKSINQDNKSSYIIESIPYRILLFEEKFLHSNQNKNDFIRDTIVPLGLQLEKALDDDLDIDIIEPLLERMKEKQISIDNEHLLSACSSTSKSEVLSLLIRFGCDINIRDENGLNVFHYAVLNNDTIALDWLYEKTPELIKNMGFNDCTVFHFAGMTDNISVLDWLYEKVPEQISLKASNGATVYNFAVNNNSDIAIIDWLYEKIPDLLNNKTIDGSNIFHWAVFSDGNTIILDWLYKKIPEQIDNTNNDGLTVFHVCNGNTAVLNWLYEKVPELLNHTAINGNTIFHQAIFNKCDTVVFDWLYLRAPELINNKNYQSDNVFHFASAFGNTIILDWLFNKKSEMFQETRNNGDTVFHQAIYSGNIAILEWIYEKDPKMIKKTTNDGSTVFHYAVTEDNIAVLDWLYEKAPELLNSKKNNGDTVFHNAVYYKGNTAILDWLYIKVPKLINYTNNKDDTVFHHAIHNGNIIILDWLYKKAPELLNNTDKNGRTVFHHAIDNDNIIILDWLYTKNPELLKHKDKNGDTVFHHIIYNKKFDVLDWLYEKMPEAKELGHTAALDWLLSHTPPELYN